MKSLLINGIMFSVVVLVILKLKESDFGKRFKSFIFEDEEQDDEIVLTDSKTDETDSAEAKPADSKTDETNSAKAELAESKTDEADSVDSKTDETDSEELPDFLEYELNEEKKRLKMMRKTSLKMVEKSFDKLEKTAESKNKSKIKDLEAETDEYVIFSMNKFNNPQSQYSPYVDKTADSKKNNNKQ